MENGTAAQTAVENGTGSSSGAAGRMEGEARNVARMIAAGEDRQALIHAKAVHQRTPSEASERILVMAYAGRISALAGRGLTSEARELLALVESRYRRPAPGIDEARASVAFCAGGVDSLVKPLADPALAPTARAAIESVIRRRVTDLDGLARTGALPVEHPLRIAAGAVWKAFTAVIAGPVEDATLSLPELSHRSPLAPWKPLVRAMAAWYRGDDGTCRRFLGAIPEDATPWRLVPVLEAATSPPREKAPKLTPAGASLATRLGGGDGALREAFRACDAAVGRKKKNDVLGAASRAVEACRRLAPDLLDRLRQHLSVIGWKLQIEAKRVQSATGGSSVKDAYFWRLFARNVEQSDRPIVSCAFWRLFHRHAVREGWFPRVSIESAAVFLHMADLWSEVEPGSYPRVEDLLRQQFLYNDAYYDDQPESVQTLRPRRMESDSVEPFDPVSLCREAAACDPSEETFNRWLAWATRTDPSGKAAEAAAAAWAEARPGDSRPLLLLLDRAERRGALKKAAGLLEAAERIDRLNPQVRRTRLRLNVASAVRHLKARKPHLLRQDLAELRARPEAQEGDRPALIEALTCALAWIEDDREQARRAAAELERLLQPGPAAMLLAVSLANTTGIDIGIIDSFEEDDRPAHPTVVARGFARACRLAQEFALAVRIPPSFGDPLRRSVAEAGSRLDPALLAALGRAAIESGLKELAYDVSTAGLSSNAQIVPRFLLLRARALPEDAFTRRHALLGAAMSLARVQRDDAVHRECVDLAAEDAPFGDRTFAPLPKSMETAEAQALIAEEIGRPGYPGPDEDDEPDEEPLPLPGTSRKNPISDFEPDFDIQSDRVKELLAEFVMKELGEADGIDSVDPVKLQNMLTAAFEELDGGAGRDLGFHLRGSRRRKGRRS